MEISVGGKKTDYRNLKKIAHTNSTLPNCLDIFPRVSREKSTYCGILYLEFSFIDNFSKAHTKYHQVERMRSCSRVLVRKQGATRLNVTEKVSLGGDISSL